MTLIATEEYFFMFTVEPQSVWQQPMTDICTCSYLLYFAVMFGLDVPFIQDVFLSHWKQWTFLTAAILTQPDIRLNYHHVKINFHQ